nr:uncharacterized protein LOC119164637 [Rhipicephalus microplus]
MDTRFAHLNPDRRAQAMSRESGDESDVGNPGEGSARESQKDDRFGNLTPERRLQELRLEMERLSQMMGGSSRWSGPEFGRRDPCSELRRYSKVLTGVLPKFPAEAEAPVWFESVESALEAYEVPGEFWGRLVFPLVAERVPFLSTRLSPTEHKDYQVIKQTVLDELRLSAEEYLKRFSGSVKRANEGWRPFSTRLESYLHFYLEARWVSTFEGLVKLLVADQLKKNLSEEALRYVTLQEGRAWMSAPEISALLRTFEEAQGTNSAARQAKQSVVESQSASRARSDDETMKGRGAGKNRIVEGKPKPRACYSCGSTGHQKWNCPQRQKQPTEVLPNRKEDSLAARVSIEGPPAAHSDLIPVSLDCKDKHIGAVLDTGAEITVVRESVVPPELVQPHGMVNLTSAFGEKVQAKLAVIPLTMSRERGVFSDVREPVPVLCALTDRLTARTDCLLSEEAWKLLHEESTLEGVVKGTSEVGGAQPEFESEPQHAEAGWRQDEVDTRVELVERHATEEVLISEVAVASRDEGDQRDDSVLHNEAPSAGVKERSPHPYRVPKSLQAEVGRQVDELLELGLIFLCESPYAHPLVCVPKKDGSVRLCVDFRALNAGTVADAYPMALQQELIMSVGKAKYITLLDLRRGYWQVPLESSSRLLTAFACHREQFAWMVMPFGLKNAAQTFQRAMNELLRPHSGYCCAYLDDIAVFSETLEEHAEHLGRVFETLKRVNLKVKRDKCQIARPSIRYLGHVVGSGRHAPDPEKLAAIKGLKAPETKRELRSVLGLCGYYRSYVKDYAEVARPLTELTGKRVPNRIPWSAEAERAFQRLKIALCEAAALSTPDPERPYWLFTDASAVAAGVCLSQRADDGTEMPIAFASHKFSPTQTRWSTIEREAFAVIWGLKRFDFWLFGAQVTVVSDHNPLAFLTQGTLPGAKLTRWALALQRYHVVVQHRKGVEHGNADALSRVPNECWGIGSGAPGVETLED